MYAYTAVWRASFVTGNCVGLATLTMGSRVIEVV
jgi:hypothetical protein